MCVRFNSRSQQHVCRDDCIELWAHSWPHWSTSSKQMDCPCHCESQTARSTEKSNMTLVLPTTAITLGMAELSRAAQQAGAAKKKALPPKRQSPSQTLTTTGKTINLPLLAMLCNQWRSLVAQLLTCLIIFCHHYEEAMWRDHRFKTSADDACPEHGRSGCFANVGIGFWVLLPLLCIYTN